MNDASIKEPDNGVHRAIDEILESCKKSLVTNGFYYLENPPSAFDYVHFAKKIGDIVPQYDGRDMWTIASKEGYENTYHSMNNKELTAHTECYEFEGLPPRYLTLLCEKKSDCGGGSTYLTDMHEFVTGLSAEQKALMEQVSIEFSSTPGLSRENHKLFARHPIVKYTSDDEYIFRYSYHCMNFRDTDICEYIMDMEEYIKEKSVEIKWKNGAFLIWDNHRVVHSRSEYKDKTRTLKRLWLD